MTTYASPRAGLPEQRNRLFLADAASLTYLLVRTRHKWQSLLRRIQEALDGWLTRHWESRS